MYLYFYFSKSNPQCLLFKIQSGLSLPGVKKMMPICLTGNILKAKYYYKISF